LQLLIEAARCGAKVRVLLASPFDEPEANRSNQATVEYLATIAAAEELDIAGVVGNPTGGGIHAKWLLARVDGVTVAVPLRAQSLRRNGVIMRQDNETGRYSDTITRPRIAVPALD
jgi:hypothetical protein